MSCHRTLAIMPGQHRAPRPTDSIPTLAMCTCAFGHLVHGGVCPRHHPGEYSDMMARHATDSLGPISPVTGERVW